MCGPLLYEVGAQNAFSASAITAETAHWEPWILVELVKDRLVKMNASKSLSCNGIWLCVCCRSSHICSDLSFRKMAEDWWRADVTAAWRKGKKDGLIFFPGKVI